MNMRRNWPLLLILAVGVLTPLLSSALFFFYRPAAQVNVGEILPPVAVPSDWRYADGRAFAAADWRGQWVLLAESGGACGADCARQLCRMRQLRLMLPGNYLKLRRVWLINDDAQPPAQMVVPVHCDEVDDAEIRRRAGRYDVLAEVTQLSGRIPDALAAENRADSLYLIDPTGVWAMRFSDELSLYQIRKDIARLLKLAKGRKTIKPTDATDAAPR